MFAGDTRVPVVDMHARGKDDEMDRYSRHVRSFEQGIPVWSRRIAEVVLDGYARMDRSRRAVRRVVARRTAVVDRHEMSIPGVADTTAVGSLVKGKFAADKVGTHYVDRQSSLQTYLRERGNTHPERLSYQARQPEWMCDLEWHLERMGQSCYAFARNE